MTTVRVVPATADRWPQLGRVFGPREKNPTSCWCQRFRRHGEPTNRDALHREIRQADPPVGLLAYLHDDVVGWTRVVPRSTLPGIVEHRALARIPSPSAVFTGTLAMFRRAGFAEIGRTYPTRLVMRRELRSPKARPGRRARAR